MEGEVRHPILALITVLLIGGSIVTAIVFATVITPKRSRVVEKQLMRPYFALIDAGRFEDAWRDHTTERFRKEWPLDKFKARWQEHLEKLGKVTKRNWFSVGFSTSRWSDTNHVVFGTKYQTWFEKVGMYVVSYEVIDEGGVPRLDWSGSTEGYSSDGAAQVNSAPY